MPAKAQRLRLRLFIEGVELPCISAQVVSAPNSPVMASIQIPPLAEGTRFLPRSLIHLFFYDFYEEENPSIHATGIALTKNPGPTTYEQSKQRRKEQEDITGGGKPFASDIEDFKNQHYKVLFVGELLGFAWTKNATSRSLVLQGQDLSNYWDYAHQYSNTNLFGPGYKAIFSGSSHNLFTDLLQSPGQIAKNLILTPSTRYPAMKGLLGGLIHLLEAMGGSYYTEKKYAGQNIFFSLAELRLHITQLITAYDKDPTAHRLLSGDYASLFGRSIGNLGDQASFRKILNKLAGVIFHETYGQPCPKFTPGLEGTVSGFVRKKILSLEGVGALGFSAIEMSDSLQVVLDSLESYATEDKPTDIRELIEFAMKRAGDNNTRLAAVQKLCHQNARRADELKGQLRRDSRSLSQMCDQAGRYFKTAASSLGKAIALQRGGKVPKSMTASGNASVAKVKEAKEALDKVPELEANVTKPKDAAPAQLKQQIFRPDVWFSAPPRCNVLFPDQYMSLNYNRSFMQEPTRLLLKTHDEFFGEDILFDSFYFAPKALTLKKDSNRLQSILRNDILDHELFTGIIPVFEKMGELNIFAARSGIVDGKVQNVGMAQRSANFLYFKYRFAARTMQVTARFNPYIACGFPGLIIDKYVDLETLRLHEKLKSTLPEGAGVPPSIPSMLGTHFLANFTDVSHQMDQSNGVTTLNCSYARQVEESVEFLGAKQEEVLTKQGNGPEATRTTKAAAIYPPHVGETGPGRGRIVSSVDVTKAYLVENFDSANKLPLLGGKRDKKTSQMATQVPVGISQKASNYGEEVAALVGDPNIIVAFKAFEITETMRPQRKEAVYLPPEEYIRPGWYGTCWHPSKIAEVYYQFFGIGSITEATQISNNVPSDVSAVPVTSSDALSTLEEAVAGGDVMKLARDQLLLLSQTKDASIQQSVALLVLTYSMLRYAGYDAEQFIRSYTWRPIATMPDMFGSSDLAFSSDGSQVERGFEGFHSRAFGQFEDLFGLVVPEIESIVGIHRGSVISKKVDTRKRKQQAVLDYVAVLKLSRGILG